MYVYRVATISRLLKITGLFCKRALQKRRYSAKETYNLKEPTNRSHPISVIHAGLMKVPTSFIGLLQKSPMKRLGCGSWMWLLMCIWRTTSILSHVTLSHVSCIWVWMWFVDVVRGCDYWYAFDAPHPHWVMSHPCRTNDGSNELSKQFWIGNKSLLICTQGHYLYRAPWHRTNSEYKEPTNRSHPIAYIHESHIRHYGYFTTYRRQ